MPYTIKQSVLLSYMMKDAEGKRTIGEFKLTAFEEMYMVKTLEINVEGIKKAFRENYIQKKRK